MWDSRSQGVVPAAGSAGAALLFAILMQPLSSAGSELLSEAVCWATLPALFTYGKRRNASTTSTTTLPPHHKSQPASSGSLWATAVAIGLVSYYRAEVGLVVLLVTAPAPGDPALTPLILSAERQLLPDRQSSKPPPFPPSFWAPLVDTVWGTSLVASFTILTTAERSIAQYALSSLPVAALLLVFVSLIPKATGRRYRFTPHINFEDDISPLAGRVFVVVALGLALQATMYGETTGSILPTLAQGLAKACSWYFTIHTASHTSWAIAPTIATFSIVATRNPFTQPSDTQVLSQAFVSLLTLGQVIYMLPKQVKEKSALWVFILVFLVPYTANILAINTAQSAAARSFDQHQQHPVEALVDKAHTDLEALLKRQSQNYTAACKEYRRRYGFEPPQGFEEWYDYAVANESPILDDFDAISSAVAPFRGLSGSEIVKIMNTAYDAADSDLWRCTFSSRRGKTECHHPYRSFDRHIGMMFDRMLGNFRDTLPDVQFLVNHLDEPRVLARIPKTSSGAPYGKTHLEMTNWSRKPSWEMLTRSCTWKSSVGDFRREREPETFGLPFVTNRSAIMDLCQHHEYEAMHGLFMSPTSLRLIEGFVPILSTGAPSTMGDLLFPSPAYIEKEFQYDEAHDIEWEDKRNNLYWAGSTTGGYASDDHWGNYQRQRFVQLAQNLGGWQHKYLRENRGVVSRIKSAFLNGRLFDVAFTRIFQCDRRRCRDQKAYFGVKSWADKDQALRSRLVFDLDGNGISGRYYKLLASQSVPLKQTLLREWHDERLVPWVHYVPVSQGMEELPELVLYLTSTERGRQTAMEIAEKGREWFSLAFRNVDMSIYTYRLMLELARLQDPEREAS
ncbi:glycosyltransferase family 90 protein [Thozetella sp. PMI_491]|nr:glycosyltransferase family 90 protein [Thozetella sp. PMI_491]